MIMLLQAQASKKFFSDVQISETIAITDNPIGNILSTVQGE